MSTTIQIVAHRGQQQTTRSKPRWQPYTPVPQSNCISSRSPAPLHPNTPKKPSVLSPHHLPPVNATSCKTIPTPLSATTPISTKEPLQRDASKQKFALTLIDQAVKTLSEVWRSHEIPAVFLGPQGRSSGTSMPDTASNAQQTPILVSTGSETDAPLLPLRNFIHEVLKRSRTSGSILQTALCYLEAARVKIPEIRRDDHMGIKSYFLPDSAILPATEAEIQLDQELSKFEATQPFLPCEDLVKTIQVSDEYMHTELDGEDACSIAAEPALSTIFSTSASLPSPLLCPRRTFLAALILASKFSQDKCYSNRAWAKLSGLPPREIGRCERALGQALDWRLWVGKSLSGPQALTSATQGRAVGRSQSEGSLALPSTSKGPFLCPQEASSSASAVIAQESLPRLASSLGQGLRRCSTLPSEPFAATPRQIPALSASDALSCDPTIKVVSEQTDVLHAGAHLRSRDLSRKSSILGHYPASSWPSHLNQVESYSSSSSESGSSPSTPPLSQTPSSAGDRTIKVANFEEESFSTMSTPHSWLDLSGPLGPVRTASPASFLNDKNPAAHMYFAHQIALNVAQSLTSRVDNQQGNYVDLSHSRGPYLWHADGGYAAPEPARVY
ncbi:hypothetical protein CPB83DRAFT_839243 [Crepidotus variabilis]|uniref:Uncharacterized protein n=1 Tax=Crepidotus variabilis TaxID=179855 RepID=A0A9P6E7N9_9AGAR|nr:hypothetical protein CPB83DRAFT_839243 [Crepidotus variabilis]